LLFIAFFDTFSCGAYYNQPTGVEKAIIGENNESDNSP
jgi:hypothetical protein